MYWHQTSGLWLPTPTGPNDGESPSWNAALERWDFSPPPSLGDLQYFDTTFAPVGLWNFNNTLADVSGNGNNLTLAAGNAGFAPVVPGKNGVFIWVGARYATAAAVPLLQLAGDMTIEAILQQDVNPIATAQSIVTYGGPGETQPDNVLYQFNISATGAFTNTRNVDWISESGAGVNATYSSSGTPASLGCIHNILFLAARRQGNVMQFFVNGLPFANASGVLATPDGGNGANTRFIVGASGPAATAADQMLLFGLKIINRALTDAEIKADYNRTMGPAFGVLS